MTVLTMLLLRYTGERTALKVAANAAGASGDVLWVERVRISQERQATVISPSTGIAA